MRIFLTGATGFLGRHITRALLDAGHTIIGSSRRSGELTGSERFRLVAHRMGDPVPTEVVEFAPESIVHLAWEGIPDFSPERCRTNRLDQEAFFAEILAVDSVRRVVVAGTCREYGIATGSGSGLVAVEPTDDFGRAKDGLHRALRERCGSEGVDLSWLRIFYVYGPGQRSESLIPAILAQIVAGDDPVVDNLDAAHDFVHVRDVAAAFVAAVEAEGPPAVADVGRGRLVRVAEVLGTARIVASGGLPDEPDPPSTPGLVAGRTAVDGLVWYPTVDLSEGIRSMLTEAVDA